MAGAVDSTEGEVALVGLPMLLTYPSTRYCFHSKVFLKQRVAIKF